MKGLHVFVERLRNKTDGGDGLVGGIVSEETKKKMSEKKVGKNNPNWKHGNTRICTGKWREKRLSELTPEEKEERRWEIHDKRILSQMNK